MSVFTVFTDKALLKQALDIQAAFDAPDANGNALYNQMRDLLVRQGEIHFEEEVRDFPHGMEVKGLGTEDFASKQECDLTAWLKEMAGPGNYLFMPSNAQGKYKDKWNWVYFKDPAIAVLFKLTWF